MQGGGRRDDFVIGSPGRSVAFAFSRAVCVDRALGRSEVPRLLRRGGRLAESLSAVGLSKHRLLATSRDETRVVRCVDGE